MILSFILVGICCFIGVCMGIKEMMEARHSPRPIKKEENQGAMYIYIDMK